MEDLANEFSSYAMIEDIGAPCGLMQHLAKNKSSDHLEDQSSNSKRNNFSNYKSKLSYSVNVPNSMISSSQKSLPKPSKHRYSTRSSSILLKSNSLVLSDSTLSDDTKADGGSFFSERKQRIKKSKRKKSEKDVQNSYPFIPINNNDQYYGKRKRSTTISHNTYDNNTVGPQMSNYTINKLKRNEFNGLSMQCDFNNSKTSKLSSNYQNESKMDCDEQEDSTSLSEDSNLSDSKFETDDNRFADDEQTDYELSSFHKRSNNRRQYGRASFEKTSSFGIINSFTTCLSSTSPSSVLWAKRRRRNLPNNHFN